MVWRRCASSRLDIYQCYIILVRVSYLFMRLTQNKRGGRQYEGKEGTKTGN